MNLNYDLSNPLVEHLNQVQSNQIRNNSASILIAAGVGFLAGIAIMYLFKKKSGGIKVEDAMEDYKG